MIYRRRDSFEESCLTAWERVLMTLHDRNHTYDHRSLHITCSLVVKDLEIWPWCSCRQFHKHKKYNRIHFYILVTNRREKWISKKRVKKMLLKAWRDAGMDDSRITPTLTSTASFLWDAFQRSWRTATKERWKENYIYP